MATKKAASKRAAPTKAASTKAAPTKAAPEKAAPKRAAPTKAAQTKAASKKAAPTKAAPKKAAPQARSIKSAAAAAPRRPTATWDVLAAGAARASGERARRRGTPLIAVADLPADAAGPAPDVAPVSEPAPRAVTVPPPNPVPEPGPVTVPAKPVTEPVTRSTPKHRPRPAGTSARPAAKVMSREGGRQRRAEPPVRTLRPVPDPLPTETPSLGTPTPVELPATPVGAGESSRTVVPGLEDLVQAGVAALRAVVGASGVQPDEVDQQVARTLAFLRRRLTGDFEVDDFGFDEDFTVNAYLPLLRPLYRTWFRVEVRGIENIPAQGGGLVVSNHSGTVAMDSLMTQVAVYDEHPAHRHLRMLGADFVFQTPLVSQVARKSGSTLAANADAERLLRSGEVVGVWPEGFKGTGKPFSERYKLQRFGRGGFVASAIRTGVPIIPCSIVGAEEIYPLIGNMKTLARLVGAPYAPITPTWPLLGPLGLIPLPSKWIIEFGVPVETADLRPGAADDPMLIFDLTDGTRETIQQTLYSLLMQRRSVFF